MLSTNKNTALKMLLVSGTIASIASPIFAAPRGEQVVRGNVTFNRAGDITRITASNGAIINYKSFNIARGELVQFIQPSSRARVLNRVLDKDPTVIAGTLTGNGRVFVVNPAGVTVTNGAVIDVGGFYAAAGNISDEDFARGINRFTNLNGSVRNDGAISGQQVVLIGQSVVNTGTITSDRGSVVLAAGNEVLIGEQGSNVYARVTATKAGTAESGFDIDNTGTINAAGGSYTAATGDSFAMAIRQGGSVKAKNVNIQGGNKTNVLVNGSIDASGATNGTTQGGNVTVVGQAVVVDSTADINATGATQGGEVLLGGGYQGQGTSLNSKFTLVQEGAKINASATENGDGGTIVVWSDGYTGVGGTFIANGAGNGSGGLVETSGKTLQINDTTNVSASGASGRNGLWLLDPQNLTISNAANSNITITDAGFRNIEPDGVDGTASGNVSIASIQTGFTNGLDVVITTTDPVGNSGADGDITWLDSAAFTVNTANLSLTIHSDDVFTLNAGVSITFSGAGVGSFSMAIDADNGMIIRGNIDMGGIPTLGDLTLTVNNPGAVIAFDSTAGPINIVGDAVVMAGDTTMAGTDDVTFTANIVTFDGLLDGTAVTPDLFVNADEINFNDNVGSIDPLAELTLRSTLLAVDNNAVAFVRGTTWELDQLDAGTAFRVDNAGNALTVNVNDADFRAEVQSTSNQSDLSFVGANTNNVRFRDDVGLAGGGNTAFASLRVQGTTRTEGGISLNTTDAGGGTGDQTFESAFIVDNSTSDTTTTINATGGIVTFADTVDDDNNNGSLTVNGRQVEFQGLVGENFDIGNLNVTADEFINFSFTGSATTGIRVDESATFTAPEIRFNTGGIWQIENQNDEGGSGAINFAGRIIDVGSTDSLVAFAADGINNGSIRFQAIGNDGTDALGNLVATATTIILTDDILTSDNGGFDGDQLYNGGVLIDDAGNRQIRLAYLGTVSLGSDPDAAVDGLGDISFRGTIDSGGGLSNGLTVETSGRREFQGNIGNSSRLGFLVTGGDQNSAGADADANPGQDIFGDSAGSAIVVRTLADGTLGGNVDLWGPTFLDNDVEFNLVRDGLTLDSAGNRTLTFRRTLDSFDTTLRNLDVSDSFRTRFFGNVGTGNRLESADVTTTVVVDSTDAPFIQFGNSSGGGATTFQFLTFAPAANNLGQRFNGPVLLDANTTVDDDNNGNIVFENTIDSFSNVPADNRSLTINTGGIGWLRGNVGATSALLFILSNNEQNTATDGIYLGFHGNSISITTSSNVSILPFAPTVAGTTAIDFRDDTFLDGDVTFNMLNNGGARFRDNVDTASVAISGLDTGFHGMTLNSGGTVLFQEDVGTTRALSHLRTDAPGFTRFGDANGVGNVLLRVVTSGSSTDIADPVSLDADLEVTELETALNGGIIRFRDSINSFDNNFRALRLLTPNGARTELWGNIGTGEDAPADAVDRALRFIQTDGVGVTQLGGNTLAQVGGNIGNGPASITIRTNGDPSTGAITSNNAAGDPAFPAIDMQDDVALDANVTLSVQANRNVRFYERIDSLNSTARSLTINNGTGTIALDDNIGTQFRLLSLATDTDAAGNSGRIRLGNNSGLNGAADGAAIQILTNGVAGVQLGDQLIDLDADILIDADNNGVVNFGANANTGITNSLDFVTGSPVFRSLTVNTGGNTRFFNTIGRQFFSALGFTNVRRRLAFITTDANTIGEGAGTVRFDGDVFLQGRSIGASPVAGQQRIVALTLNDQTIIIGDITTDDTTSGVTFDSNIVGGGGAMRFRGDVVTDGTPRNFRVLTNAQTLTRSQFFALTQPNRELWVQNMLAPVAFGGNVGSSGARFSSVVINNPGSGPFGLRGTGQSSDIGNVPMVATIFWANGDTAWGTDDAWSLTTASVGPLNTAANTRTFSIFTSGNIDFGQNEKGTAYGNLSLLSSAGQIFIGDLNAVGAKGAGGTSGRLIVGEAGNTFAQSATQKRIMVRTRTGSRVTKWDDGTLKSFTDQGVDFVANRINFRFSPARVAPGTNVASNLSKKRIQFATPSGDGVTIAGSSNPSFIVRFFREELFPRQFVNGSNPQVFLFDLPAKGISQAERATAFAVEGWHSAAQETYPAEMIEPTTMIGIGNTPADPVILAMNERQALSNIGVLTRTQTAAQMLDNMIGRELYNDRPNMSTAANASDAQRAISLPRINRKAALALVAESQRLMSAGGGDISRAMSLIDQLGVSRAEAEALKGALSRRFNVQSAPAPMTTLPATTPLTSAR